MISVNNITLTYGGFTLLDNISFHIGKNDKIGLVGKNGAGKSTIMKLICGILQAEVGSISKIKNITIGYLPQVMSHSLDKTVIEELMTVFESPEHLEKELKRISKELESREDYESDGYMLLVDRFNDIHEQLTDYNAGLKLSKAQRLLINLGFKEEDLDKSTAFFSQGWNMRIELAKIILRKPDILLLDEPTNHLDIESIEWLENYLKAVKSSILLISHDKRFLDNISNRTIEIVLGDIHDYKVPYSKYLQLREERYAQQLAAHANQQREIEKTEEFIKKFRYKASKANQVQSRIKALEKMDIVKLDTNENAYMKVQFTNIPRAGDLVYKATGLTLAYPPKVVAKDINIEVKRGEKVAFVGRNGEGKSTMVKTIIGEVQAFAGSSKLGYNVSVGYFAQNQDNVLDKEDTVFSTLDKIATGEIRKRLRDILAQFLFKGEDIDKKVAVLSGGERARLGMAKLMLNTHNLLILDEPTNHLDILSKDVLKQALSDYPGSIILVSHDRDFLEGLTTKLYEFRNGQVKEYLGTIGAFLEKKRLDNLRELERGSKQMEDARMPKVSKTQKKYLNSQKENNKIKAVERSISELELKIKGMEQRFANSVDIQEDELLRRSKEYMELKLRYEEKFKEWEELISKL